MGTWCPENTGQQQLHRAIDLDIPDLNWESSLWTDLAAFFAVSMMIEVVIVLCLRAVAGSGIKEYCILGAGK